MDHDDDGETSYNTFVDDVAIEPTYLRRDFDWLTAFAVSDRSDFDETG